jgi:hypothetical protein
MHLYPVPKNTYVNSLFIQHGCDKETRDLLCKLPLKELDILVKHTDILGRVKNIAKMSYFHLEHLVTSQYGLKVDAWGSGDYYLGVTGIDDRAPSWWHSDHVGWIFHLGDTPQFTAWARDFLMQEVRINIWMRYLEYKRTELKSKPLEVDPADIPAATADLGHFGSFL